MNSRLLAFVFAGVCLSHLTVCGQTPTGVLKAEIKWTVPAENIPNAMEVLKLKMDDAKKEEVWFFDTKDQELRSKHHLVLRARRNEKKETDSTVKLRLTDAAGAAGTASEGGKVELDWGEVVQNLSRSENAEGDDLPDLDKVIEGTESIEKLFPKDGQKSLLAPAQPDLDWSKLKRYGPVEALEWKNKDGKPPKVQFAAYPKASVELWHLKKGDKQRSILEISIKTEGTREEIEQQAVAFFAAVKKAVLSDSTKTKAVLEFFAPGK